ncbi:unnamed protein product [Paramecium sonneborni]|uniref:Uncharacterized protein n=1 Tax=Paramecium sonneborni TaxID=65129 RepID=A0A8S1LVW0_9CILI|nr:unnamed protein product [Paramecium sonneborni]
MQTLMEQQHPQPRFLRYGLNGSYSVTKEEKQSHLNLLNFNSQNLVEVIEEQNFNLLPSIEFQIQFEQSDVEFKIEEITQTTIKVARVDYIKFNVLLVTDQSLWSSPISSQSQFSGPFVNRSSSPYSAQIVFSHLQELTNNANIPIIAIRGLPAESSRNFTFTYHSVTLDINLSFKQTCKYLIILLSLQKKISKINFQCAEENLALFKIFIIQVNYYIFQKLHKMRCLKNFIQNKNLMNCVFWGFN